MKFELNRDTALQAIKTASNAVPRKSTLPVLTCLLLRLNGDQVIFTGSDLQSQVSTSDKLNESFDAFQIAMNARKLHDIFSSMAIGSTASIEIEKNFASIKSNRSTFKINIMDASSYPFISPKDKEEVQSFQLTQKILNQMIGAVQDSAGSNDISQHLNGVLFESNDGLLNLIATNGHRLATTSTTIENKSKFSFIIPNKTVQELLRSTNEKSDDEILIEFGSSQVSFKYNNIAIITKLLEGKYPDWSRVVPKTSQDKILIPVGMVKSALSRTKVFLNDKNTGVVISFSDGIMKIQPQSIGNDDSCVEEIDVEMKSDVGFIGSFNINYLFDAFNSVTADEVCISKNSATSPMMIEVPAENNFKAVVMGLRN